MTDFMKQTMVVVDSAGDEHSFTNDDETEYLYRYGNDIDGNPTQKGELIIYEITEGPRRPCSVFFHPRYLKIFWE